MNNLSLIKRLQQWAVEQPQAPMHYVLREKAWMPITSQQVWHNVGALALFLENKGVTKGSTVAIFASNSSAWICTELGAILLGLRSAGIYPNMIAKDVDYIVRHSNASVLVVQNKDFFDRLGEFKDAILKQVKILIVLEGDVSFFEHAIRYEDALREGEKLLSDKKVKALVDVLDSDQGSFIIYTSGTTGFPKGAMLSEKNLAFSLDQIAKHWRLPAVAETFSFLPLCHVAEKMQGIAASVSLRYPVYFASSMDRLMEELAIVQPRVLLCVPRVWEKMMEGVQQKVMHAKGVKAVLARYAFKVAQEREVFELNQQKVPLWLQAQCAGAEHLIFSKIRKALGLSRVLVAGCGAGALSEQVWSFFRHLNIRIEENYGQTETSGVIVMTKPSVIGRGFAGFPLPMIEVKIAEDGEILVKGPNLFKGYLHEENKDYLTEDGWLCSGDLGYWGASGQLKIVGRKKEILKTSGGKIISPAPIEQALQQSYIISQVCIVGDNKKYPAALIVLSPLFIKELQRKGVVFEGDGVVQLPEVRKKIQHLVDTVNQTLSHYQQIKSFTVLRYEFSVERGEMTPTLKLKRHVIQDHYRFIIDAMYGAHV